MLVRSLTLTVLLTFGPGLVHSVSADTAKVLQHEVFSAIERQIIERYYKHRPVATADEGAEPERKGKGKSKGKH